MNPNTQLDGLYIETGPGVFLKCIFKNNCGPENEWWNHYNLWDEIANSFPR